MENKLKTNKNGEFGVGVKTITLHEEFEYFDNLPREIRDIINEASYKACCKQIAETPRFQHKDTLAAGLSCALRLNAAAAYGPDHPQAKEIQ